MGDDSLDDVFNFFARSIRPEDEPEPPQAIKRSGAVASFEAVTRHAETFYRVLSHSERAEAKRMLLSRRDEASAAPHNTASHIASRKCKGCRNEAIACVVFDSWNGG